MAVTAHVFPNFTQLMSEGDAASNINLNSGVGTVDTVKVALYTGSLTWNSTLQSVVNVSGGAAGTSFASGSGAGALTEVAYTGATPATRFTLTGVNLTTSGLVNTLTATSPAWANATWTAAYALFYDYTAGGNSDTAGIPLCYWDFGGPQSVSGATFTLTVAGSGLVSWTSS